MRTEEEPVYLGGWRSWKLDGGIEGKGVWYQCRHEGDLVVMED